MVYLRVSVIFLLIVASGCAHHRTPPPEQIRSFYFVNRAKDTLLTRYAPVFLTYDHGSDYNRIGTPSATRDENGKEGVRVDTQRPAVYCLEKAFSGECGRYTNLIYRVHFPEVPFSLIPFHLTAGKNVGLIIVITLDENEHPVLVTSAGTCGCYCAIVPTSHLSPEAFPENWKDRPLKVYGETLPAILDYGRTKCPQLIVHVRPGVHRIMELEIVDWRIWSKAPGRNLIKTDLVPVEKLEAIPVDGHSTSFYHQEGVLKGHVKGSVKPWETIFLSLISLDLFVGTDKSYANSDCYDNPFYTSLKPWNRKKSDMYHFDRFLRFWGWRL